MSDSARTQGLHATSRMIRGDDDFWRVHRLLVETHPVTTPGHNWNVRRWEGLRFYGADPAWDQRWERKVRLWEAGSGELLASAHHEGTGDVHLQVRPDHRHLEDEMIAWAEENLSVVMPGEAEPTLRQFVFEHDTERQRLLESRGYEKLASGGVTRRMRFGEQTPALPEPAAGYRVRATRPDEHADCERIADVLNAGFGRESHTAEEYRTFTLEAPSFRQGLDLVAEAPDGSFAAYVGVPYDAANACGLFEPVCAHPAHRRKGLAQALMLEGLKRLESMGAREVIVETGDRVAANRLYESVGFTESYKGFTWRKTL